MNVGWIGTGIMGRAMAEHLVKAGYSLTVYNRSLVKAESLQKLGCRFASVSEIAATSDIVFTMVGYPRDVEEVILGPEGILANARPGTLIVDHTTSSPSLAHRIYTKSLEKGLQALDAPVSGGEIGALQGKLAIMVGGEVQAFERAKPLMEKYGLNIQLMGSSGAGQHTKMTNQIVIAGNVIGLVEGLTYAVKAGLNANQVIDLISKGAADSFQLRVLGPCIMKGDLEPKFYVEHFVKDMGLALEECSRMQISLPGLSLVNQLYLTLMAHGEGKKGTQALIRALERMNNLKISPT
jgi:3-hydroxyisobutyrate dehydrogenase